MNGMPGRTKLSEEQVVEVLRCTGSLRALAARFGVNPSTLSLIRRGQTHANVAPHIPRWSGALRCENCIHWCGVCGLGFPDPSEEGTAFARECSAFTTVS